MKLWKRKSKRCLLFSTEWKLKINHPCIFTQTGNLDQSGRCMTSILEEPTDQDVVSQTQLNANQVII